MKVLITLGPTQEPIDRVRYITNPSSGKMGLALAAESLGRGHETSVICGPIHLAIPEGIKVYRIRTASEMIDLALKELNNCDVFICAAAIADYTPATFQDFKIKSGDKLTLKLKQTQKLTRLAKQKFPGTFVVGFKAEYSISADELVEITYSKLKKENLNLVVANDIQRNKFGSDTTEVWVVNPGKKVVHIPKDSKEKIAEEIWGIIEKYL